MNYCTPYLTLQQAGHNKKINNTPVAQPDCTVPKKVDTLVAPQVGNPVCGAT